MSESFALPPTEGSKEWWAKKYAQSSGHLFGKAPSEFLVESIPLLRKGESLDVAMGEGRNAVYLASKGFQITGVDFIETAVERAKTMAKESGVSFESKCLDLSFFLIPLMKYDAITVIDFRPPLTLFKSLARGLKPGGTLLLEGYTIEHLRAGSGYKPEPFECFKPNEALGFVQELHLVLYNEREVTPGNFRTQMIARKPLR